MLVKVNALTLSSSVHILTRLFDHASKHMGNTNTELKLQKFDYITATPNGLILTYASLLLLSFNSL